MKTAVLAGLAALLCAGCAAPPTRVVLLPQAGGTGAVEVSTAAGRQRLEHGYAEADVQASGAITLAQLDAQQIKERYHLHPVRAQSLICWEFPHHTPRRRCAF